MPVFASFFDIKNRLRICSSCEFLKELTRMCYRCEKCGCFVEVKARLYKSSCPINKW